MDPIEKAIRTAFEKGDADDRAFREKVYRKAFSALDRAIQANPSLTVETAINRRKALQSKITEIESEFIPASAPDAPDPLEGPVSLPASAELDDVVPDLSEPAQEAELDAVTVGALGGLDMAPERRDTAPAGVPGGPDLVGDIDPARRRRRRPLAIAFVAATVIAMLGIGYWFAEDTGLFLTPEERDTSVPNPPDSSEAEDFVPENEEPVVQPGRADPDRNWITIFDPANAARVSAPSGTSAEVQQDDTGSFLRIRSGADGAAVIFDVGQGILERVAGRSVTFDVVARAETEQGTEMSIDCNFGELGDCGRRRYAVGYERADYLFELTLPQAAPGAGGTIAIVPDFAKQGRAADIYEIRVAPSR